MIEVKERRKAKGGKDDEPRPKKGLIRFKDWMVHDNRFRDFLPLPIIIRRYERK